MPVGWSRQRVVGWVGSPDGDELAAIVGESEPVGIDGVSADEELAAVVGVVMLRAKHARFHVSVDPPSPQWVT